MLVFGGKYIKLHCFKKLVIPQKVSSDRPPWLSEFYLKHHFRWILQSTIEPPEV